MKKVKKWEQNEAIYQKIQIVQGIIKAFVQSPSCYNFCLIFHILFYFVLNVLHIKLHKTQNITISKILPRTSPSGCDKHLLLSVQ